MTRKAALVRLFGIPEARTVPAMVKKAAVESRKVPALAKKAPTEPRKVPTLA